MFPAVADRVTAGSVAATLAMAKRSGTLGNSQTVRLLMQIRQHYHTVGSRIWTATWSLVGTTQTHSTGTTDNNPSPIPCYNSGPTWLDSSCAGQYPHLCGQRRSLSLEDTQVWGNAVSYVWSRS